MKKQSMDIAPQRKPQGASPRAALDEAKAQKFNEALGDDTSESSPVSKADQSKPNMTTEPPSKPPRKKFWKDWSKKQRIVFLVILIVAIVAASFLVYWYGFAQRGEIVEEETVAEEPQGPMTRSPLTGLEVPPATAEQTPMAVVIENLTTVRPQSSISRADVVYEFLAEGGITRFLVVFASNEILEPDLVGPIRSLRAYFVPVGLELLAPVYHVGGAPNALERARDWGMRDVNQFFDSTYFWRDSSVNGEGAPHNMYSRMPELKYAIRDHSWPQDDGKNIRAWEFKEEAGIEERGEVVEIHVPFSSRRYNVTWVYDKIKNRYDRYQGDGTDEPHLDRNNDEQLSARNVIVQYVEGGPLPGDDKGRMDFSNDEGEGDADIFFDGQVIEATWKKESRDARTIFYKRGTDEEIEFIPGQFWVEVLTPDKKATWITEGETVEEEVIIKAEGE